MMRSLVAVAFLVAACASPPPPVASTPKGQRELELLASFFTGNWDTRPAGLRMRVAEFWKGTTARWFYLEWSRPGAPQPTRQLALRVTEAGGGHFAGEVYRLPDPSRYAGEWSKPQPFASLRPEDLSPIEECRMRIVHTLAAHFTLVTVGTRCPGDMAGSPYMRLEFSLASSELNLLEQPRDSGGDVTPNSRLEPFHYFRTSREPG